jgi:AAA domain
VTEFPFNQETEFDVLCLLVRKPGLVENVLPEYFQNPEHLDIARVVSEIREKHPRDKITKHILREKLRRDLHSRLEKTPELWANYKALTRKIFAASLRVEQAAELANDFAKERQYRSALVKAEEHITRKRFDLAAKVFLEVQQRFTNSRRAKVWESEEFQKAEFPPREPLAVIQGFDTPVFTARSLNEIFAWRGTGKSMFALGLASAFSAKREFLNWKITRKCRVLLVDGEMPNTQIQQRMRQLFSSKASIRIITQEDQEIPSLATAEGQAWLERELGDAEVLILDSVTSLAPFATNDEDLWLPFSSWLQRLRHRGLCIIRLMQAGKLGSQRGHSRSEDLLDVQLKLTAKEEDCEHLKVELAYTKFRGMKSGVQPLAIELRNGERRWRWKPLNENKLATLREWMAQNKGKHSSRQIAKELPELGSHVTVANLLNKLNKR